MKSTVRVRLIVCGIGFVASAGGLGACLEPSSEGGEDWQSARDRVAGEVTRVFPVVRDNVVEEAHKGNNDGSWGYGWIKVSQGAHNYGLLGFDISSLSGMSGAQVVSAVLKLRVGQNHFAQDGKWYDIHRIDMNAPAVLRDWVEGDDRWDLFSYCSHSEWARPAEAIGGPGSTWTCARDSNVRDGSLACTTTAHKWDSSVNGAVQAGFIPTPSQSVFEKKAYPGVGEAEDKCPELLVGNDDCNPSCGQSIACLDGGGSVDECYRTVKVDLTEDVRLFVDSGYWSPSWLIKRQDNSGAGAFHYFSREGAICILGNCQDPAEAPYWDLRPVLEVVLTAAPALPLIEPDIHCAALAAECSP